MRYLSFWSVVAIYSALSGALYAASKVCDPEHKTQCAIALKKGYLAPFDGQLLSDDLAIKIGLKLENCLQQLAVKNDLELAIKKLKIDLQLSENLRKLDTAKFLKQKNLLINRLKMRHATPFFEKPLVVIIITTVAVSALFIGAKAAFCR